MDVEVGKLVGKLGQKAWAQVYDFTPEGEEKLLKRGRLVAVVGMETPEEVEQVEMVQVGREVLARLHELYYGQEAGGAWEVLKGAVRGVREEFEGIGMVCMAAVGEVVYVVAGGGAGVWVSLPERQGWLVRPEEERGGEVAFSGRAEKGEVLVMGNRGFFGGVPEGLLRAAVATAGEEMEAAVDVLAAVQRGSESGGGEAGAIIKIQMTNDKLQMTKGEEEKEVGEEREVAQVVSQEEEEKENIWGRVRERIRGKWPSGWKGKIYIRHGDKQEQRRRMMYTGIGFLVILLLMAGLGQMWLRQRTQKKSQEEERIEKLVFDFNEAKAMIPLNSARSRQLLEGIKTDLDQLKQSKEKDPRVAEVEAEWEQAFLEAMAVVRVEMKELVDLNLVRKGMVGSKMALIEGKLVVLDGVGGRVVEIEEKSGAGKVVAGGEEMKGASLLATYPEKTLVLSEKGIMEIGEAKVKVVGDTEWGEIVDMEMYAGNIYLLDRGKGQIWRYGAKTGGYGEKQVWLATKGGEEELKKALGMAINGSIWVVEPGGLVKYTRGVRDDVVVEGMDKPWGGKAVIYTSDEAEKVYVLDPENKRVVVLGKEAVYEKQWVNDGLERIGDMVVDEKGGWVFGLGEGKIWVVKI